MTGEGKSQARFMTVMAVAMVIWGGSWVSAKAITMELPAETLTFWRFVITSIALSPAVFFLKEPVRLTKKGLFYSITGAAAIGIYLDIFFKALRFTGAGEAGIFVTMMIPVATFVLSAAFLGEGAGGVKGVIGLALGVTGGAIMQGGLDTGGGYLAACAVLWAVVTMISKKAGEEMSPLLFSIVTSVFSSVFFLYPAIKAGGVFSIFDEGGLFWFNMLYLSVVSSGIATTAYFFASSRIGAGRASSFTFLVPISAVVLSWFFLGEKPGVSALIGGAAAMFAVYLINTSKKASAGA